MRKRIAHFTILGALIAVRLGAGGNQGVVTGPVTESAKAVIPEAPGITREIETNINSTVRTNDGGICVTSPPKIAGSPRA